MPLDATETLDTDGDGIGNNADTDDDGDGMSDAQEVLDGTSTGLLRDGLSCHPEIGGPSSADDPMCGNRS